MASSELGFLWEVLGPYHRDRLCAVAAAVDLQRPVEGWEFADRSRTYDWTASSADFSWHRRTLFPGRFAEDVSSGERLPRVFTQLLAPRVLFLAGYERPELFILALVRWLFRRPTFLMLDSKFDDKPRRLLLEALKLCLCLPYAGALVAGARHMEYVRFLGFRRRPVTIGYDVVSHARLRGLASQRSEDVAFSERAFLSLARFVPKKNLLILIEAFGRYCRANPHSRRQLVLAGGGALEAELRRSAERVGAADRVRFHGFVGEAEVAMLLSQALGLFLISTEEQWGLVVNEALAFGVPVVVSPAVGARDNLVRTEVNGFLVEPDNPVGLAAIMARLNDRPTWERLSAGTEHFAALADSSAFVQGVRDLLAARPPRRATRPETVIRGGR